MGNKLWSSVQKGAYSGATAYTVGDFVTYNGSSYTCILNSTGNLPTNTTYWALVANKGDTGTTGSTGATGATGATGSAGANGTDGDKGGLRYNFSTTTTDSDPGQGIFRYNNATIGSVTSIFIDLTDINGVDFTSYIDSWDDSTNTVKGYLEIKSNTLADTTINIWRIDGWTTATGYRKITVTYISGALPSDAEACVVSFYRTGDKGADGAGSGDMLKSVYDSNNDGVILKAQLDPALANTSGTNTGDQTLPTRASLGLDTTDNPQFAGINLGHATDTTLTRTGAGDIAIEGNAVYRAGGTDVPVADGGTGVSSLTAYAVLCGGTTTTGAVQSIASVGTSGQVLTSGGAGALPTFQAAAGGGGMWTLVSSGTISAGFTISSLDGNTDIIYKVILYTTWGTIGGWNLKFNADAGNNYLMGGERIYGTASTEALAGHNNTRGSLDLSFGSVSAKREWVEITIHAEVAGSHKRYCRISRTWVSTTGNDDGGYSEVWGTWTNTVDNITSLVFAIEAGATPAGKYAIYKATDM